MDFKLVKDEETLKKLEEFLKELGLPYVEWESYNEPVSYISVKIQYKAKESI